MFFPQTHKDFKIEVGEGSFNVKYRVRLCWVSWIKGLPLICSWTQDSETVEVRNLGTTLVEIIDFNDKAIRVELLHETEGGMCVTMCFSS